jgi:hypothetical protein
MNPDTPEKYDLKVKVNDKKIPMIPFIKNTFGHVFIAVIQDLENIGTENQGERIICNIFPTQDKGDIVKIKIAEQELTMKPFIQDMIWKTLAGFLSSLKKMPENLLKAHVYINMQKK